MPTVISGAIANWFNSGQIKELADKNASTQSRIDKLNKYFQQFTKQMYNEMKAETHQSTQNLIANSEIERAKILYEYSSLPPEQRDSAAAHKECQQYLVYLKEKYPRPDSYF